MTKVRKQTNLKANLLKEEKAQDRSAGRGQHFQDLAYSFSLKLPAGQ